MRVKICGITNLQDALDAINCGADALGFVFYSKSPRYITPSEARKIIDKLPPFVQVVGLFVNEGQNFINEVCAKAKIQLAQIIDDEDILDFDKLNIKAIKVKRVKNKQDLQNLEDEYFLVDAFVSGFGGEGKRIFLDWFENTDCSKLILAGGLKTQNLKELNGYGFFGVDVSSGVEKSKGKKDKEKMNSFIKEARKIK